MEVLEYLEFTQLSNCVMLIYICFMVLEYLEFTQLSNEISHERMSDNVLEYLEFTQLSNPWVQFYEVARVLEYLEFTQLSNPPPCCSCRWMGFRVLGIYTALKRAVNLLKHRAWF